MKGVKITAILIVSLFLLSSIPVICSESSDNCSGESNAKRNIKIEFDSINGSIVDDQQDIVESITIENVDHIKFTIDGSNELTIAGIDENGNLTAPYKVIPKTDDKFVFHK